MTDVKTLDQQAVCQTPYTPGEFVWHELMTSDVPKAVAFYGALFGWTFEDMQMSNGTYTMVHADGKGIGGILGMDGQVGIPTHWVGYVSAPDIDAAAETATKAGGLVVMAPTDIPGVGRFAVVVDPQGAVTMPFRSIHGDPVPGAPGVGTFCWDQLNVADPQAVAPFYKALYGWSKTDSPMAPDMFVFTHEDGEMAASLMKAPEGVHGHWLSYVVVTDLTAANAKAIAHGATVMMEHIEVPTMGTFSVIQDPVGAYIALFQSTHF